MRCPACNQTDAYYGFMGWNCMNLLCEHFKNGRSQAINSQPATKEFRVGDRVNFDLGYLMFRIFGGIYIRQGEIKSIHLKDDGSKDFTIEYVDDDGRYVTIQAFEDTISHI